MASEFTLTIGEKVTPKNKGGPRVGVGGYAYAGRDSDGAIGVQLLRGDGALAEQFDYSIRSRWIGPLSAGEVVKLELPEIDLALPDFTPRSYRLRVVADGGAELDVREAFLATEPYAPAGKFP